ncbi:metallo-beta-lactamase domain protein, partial [Fusobacterium sp. CM21]
VIYTPGHTVGSVSFYSDDLEENEAFKKVIFTGDSLFAGSIGRVDFPTGNEDAMRRTLEEVFKKMAPDTVVFPGHGAATTIERELAHNPYLR